MTVYKVTSKTRYRGHAEGEEFEADLSEAEENRLKKAGAIRVVKRDDNDKPKKEKENDG